MPPGGTADLRRPRGRAIRPSRAAIRERSVHPRTSVHGNHSDRRHPVQPRHRPSPARDVRPRHLRQRQRRLRFRHAPDGAAGSSAEAVRALRYGAQPPRVQVQRRRQPPSQDARHEQPRRDPRDDRQPDEDRHVPRVPAAGVDVHGRRRPRVAQPGGDRRDVPQHAIDAVALGAAAECARGDGVNPPKKNQPNATRTECAPLGGRKRRQNTI
mmetsp:Transcript_5735/g.14330  ORF Transcript_5735/g.14330 Transcript_5735/m.14330 type:complete len:212 (-) Transcript_5735:41-676(-)